MKSKDQTLMMPLGAMPPYMFPAVINLSQALRLARDEFLNRNRAEEKPAMEIDYPPSQPSTKHPVGQGNTERADTILGDPPGSVQVGSTGGWGDEQAKVRAHGPIRGPVIPPAKQLSTRALLAELVRRAHRVDDGEFSVSIEDGIAVRIAGPHDRFEQSLGLK